MEVRPVARPSDAFQRPVTGDQIVAMCGRAFGSAARPVLAVELGDGMYNNTYRVELDGVGPVILRVAPQAHTQFRIERGLMRNEHASVPYLAPIAAMIPRTLAADFTHEVIDRDYLFQSVLDGIPGPEGIGRYPRELWPGFFRGLGEIARRIHGVVGARFGPVAGPWYGSWSEALTAYFNDLAADLADAGLDPSDAEAVASAVGKYRSVVDEIAQPRLLHGDLWTVNVMMDAEAAEPTISGVFDNDRTLWGDPEADWPIYMAGKKPGTERDAFWDAYGPVSSSPSGRLRALIYLARHIGAIRLERHRLGNTEGVAETYVQMGDVVDRLRSG